MRDSMRLVGLTAICIPLSSCYLAHEEPPEPPPPADPGCVETTIVEGRSITEEKVDLLLMIDNSNSMGEEQASLASALPALFRAIASGDADLDGTPDFPPVGSIHFGVVTSDMGTGGFSVPTCAEPLFGDDGVLQTRSGGAFPGCDASYPSFLEFDPRDESTVEEFASRAGCVAVAGTGGCGFEQQLEAVLKALTPEEDPLVFASGTRGRGTGANDGFLRDDSILVVLLVTDENDCSAADPELFNPSSSVYRGDLNLRCAGVPGRRTITPSGALHPVERYVDGLLALRPVLPQRLVFSTIAGIPPELSGEREAALLADPILTERVDPSMPTRLTPSCDVPGRGFAFPPTRLLEVSRGIAARGGRTINQSICQDDFTPAVAVILDEIRGAARRICVPED